KVIYDAAHAFAVQKNGRSVLLDGDMSVLSFHATKVFNTFEGGAIIARDAEMKQRIDYLKNFGFADEVTIVAPGINGKMSEVNAAMGLLQLRYVDQVLKSRAEIYYRYYDAFANISTLRIQQPPKEITWNYAYCPIFVAPDHPLGRNELYMRLREQSFYGRRYFYPLVSSFPMYRGLPSATSGNLRNATNISEQVIC